MPLFTNEDIVTGTVDANITNPSLPVTGPLTDAELRASPIDVNATFTPSGTQDVNIVSTIPVPVTDNGGALTVDGTVAISGSVAVTGPLTDTQLRATSVPVSGPLTDTQLRATPVPVSGTVTATGPLTDTQLRATPVPVISGSSGTAVVTSVSVSTVVATVLTSLSTRSKFILYNEAGTLYVKLGTGATASDYSMRLTANAAWEFSGYSGVITAIKQSGTTALLVTSVQ